ncbi:helix-turn-helix domain-containing protein [Vibrio parahaemolyticus]|uniref:helix-turn-helix domain-containing protein n=1 Tax=Vibrio parahaemolyticus TaxID=670 RepID=UPI00084A93B8|nr:helix-turn-helix domain-containing protein [Vibrio parahaemolyticus]EGQ8262190.1 helix-turn-helix domain-containing protein [Vibrio parahaemolyticus]EGQ8842695.1 helix-turn-helix domain-containing protein [Vibrio parahaemolyticus]EGQ9511608.1 helix-turn-helix domain-containing protein [Vibrio parahaemolyticus]EGR2252103.1 helix-turn-helix domain-containing protein [Vibrio parahaemolyticus]EHU0317692.1 helix-turn-helix domain-containing protein [Vibrio parahaemolyticus]
MKKGGRPFRFDDVVGAELAILACLGIKSISSLARENGCSRNTVTKYVNRFKERLEVLGYAD